MWGLRSKILFPSAALRVLHEFLSSACTYSDIKMKSTLAVFLEEADLLGPESFAHVGRGSLSSSPCSPRSAVGASVEGVVLGWALSWGALGLEDKSAAQRQWGLGAEAPGESKRQQIHVTSAFSNYLPPPPRNLIFQGLILHLLPTTPGCTWARRLAAGPSLFYGNCDDTKELSRKINN